MCGEVHICFFLTSCQSSKAHSDLLFPFVWKEEKLFFNVIFWRVGTWESKGSSVKRWRVRQYKRWLFLVAKVSETGEVLQYLRGQCAAQVSVIDFFFSLHIMAQKVSVEFFSLTSLLHLWIKTLLQHISSRIARGWSQSQPTQWTREDKPTYVLTAHYLKHLSVSPNESKTRRSSCGLVIAANFIGIHSRRQTKTKPNWLHNWLWIAVDWAYIHAREVSSTLF